MDRRLVDGRSLPRDEPRHQPLFFFLWAPHVVSVDNLLLALFEGQGCAGLTHEAGD